MRKNKWYKLRLDESLQFHIVSHRAQGYRSADNVSEVIVRKNDIRYRALERIYFESQSNKAFFSTVRFTSSELGYKLLDAFWSLV